MFSCHFSACVLCVNRGGVEVEGAGEGNGGVLEGAGCGNKKIKLGIKSVALSWQELWVGFEDAKLALGTENIGWKSFMLALVLGGKEALILVSFIRGVLARNHSAVGD